MVAYFAFVLSWFENCVAKFALRFIAFYVSPALPNRKRSAICPSKRNWKTRTVCTLHVLSDEPVHLLEMGRVLGIGIGNCNYRNFFWYRNRRILIEFPILKTILWNLYGCNLNYNLKILGHEYE